MSKTFDTVLSGLKNIGSSKLAELDSIFESHRAWLASAVEDAKKHLADLEPAIKKQKTGNKSNKEAGEYVANKDLPKAYRDTIRVDTLASTAEDGAKAQEERENVEEPSHLPAVEEAVPAPSKRATRSRRGKRQMEEAQDAEMQKEGTTTETPTETASAPKETMPPVASTVSRPKRTTRRGKAKEAPPPAVVAEVVQPVPEEEPAEHQQDEVQQLEQKETEPKQVKKQKKPATKKKAPSRRAAKTCAAAPPPTTEVPLDASQQATSDVPPQAEPEVEVIVIQEDTTAEQQQHVENRDHPPKAKPVSQARKAATKKASKRTASKRTKKQNIASIQEEVVDLVVPIVVHQDATVGKEEGEDDAEIAQPDADHPDDGALSSKNAVPAVQAAEEEAVEIVSEKKVDRSSIAGVAQSENTAKPAMVKLRNKDEDVVAAAGDGALVGAVAKHDVVADAAVDNEDPLTAVPPSGVAPGIAAAEDKKQAKKEIDLPCDRDNDTANNKEQVQDMEIDNGDNSANAVQNIEHPVSSRPTETTLDLSIAHPPTSVTSAVVAVSSTVAVLTSTTLPTSLPASDPEVQEQQHVDTDDEPKTAPLNRSIVSNVVSSIRSFLPTSGKGPGSPGGSTARKAPKVKALEAAEAAKRKEVEKTAERARQKMEAERLRQERLKAKAEAEASEAKRREEARVKKELEAAQRRKEREEAERKEREEKARRLEELKQKRREEAARGPAISSAAADSLAEAKERLAKIQGMMKSQSGIASSASKPPSLSGGGRLGSAVVANGVAAPAKMIDNALAMTYEISPYKSDFESDDDVPKKPVPDWARGKSLVAQLMAQMYVDPDEVFQQHAKTCSLDEVFASNEKTTDFNRRSSSGNWLEDRVTWKEEMSYKKAMGYI